MYNEAGIPAKSTLAQWFSLFDDQPSSIAIVSIIGSIGDVAKVHVLDIDMFQVIIVTLMG